MLLTRLREKRGEMTQEQLATLAGVSLGTVNGAERGRGVTLNTAKKLAKALRKKVEDLT